MAKRDEKDKVPEQETPTPTPGDPGSGGDGNPPSASTKMTSALQNALQIPTSYPTGAPRVDENIVRPIDANKFLGVTRPVAGIYAIDMLPTYGVTDSYLSALNRASFLQFNAIRSKISGNRPYEPADHMIYRICNWSLRELMDVLIRAYRTLRVYRATNMYTPRALFAAYNLDFDDYVANAATLKQFILMNEKALDPFPNVKIGQISDRRHMWNSAIFTDGDIAASQLYVMNQKYFYSYEVVDQVKGMVPKKLGPKVSDAIELWNTLYSAFQRSSDVYLIAADIRRAFENEVVTSLEIPDLESEVPLGKSDGVLVSLRNAEILPGADTLADTLRVQDQNGNLFVPLTVVVPDFNVAEGSNYMVPAHLNSVCGFSEGMSQDDLLRAMRFKPAYSARISESMIGETQHTNLTYEFTAMGTELLVGARIIMSPNGSDSIAFASGMVVPFEPRQHALLMEALSNFDWHAPMVTFTASEGPGRFGEPHIIADNQNYIPITDTQIRQIHDAYLLSEFGID